MTKTVAQMTKNQKTMRGDLEAKRGSGEAEEVERTNGGEPFPRDTRRSAGYLPDRPPISHSDFVQQDYETIVTWCAFCGSKLTLRQPKNRRVKNHYYCDERCREDYAITQQPDHPSYGEVMARRRRLLVGVSARVRRWIGVK